MIYLDNAATSMQKPKSVSTAMFQAVEQMASPGRGGHYWSMLAAETVFQCREKAAMMFEAEQPEQVVFTSNATHGLNIAIKSVVKPGSKVLISGYEHNAVMRPLRAISHVKNIIAACPLFRPDILLDNVQKILQGGVDAAVFTHVSNVFGFVLPIDEISAMCSQQGVPLIVDASQSAGCIPVSMRKWRAKFIAMPGHKGLYGPQGTGILICADENVDPLIEGGTGSVSINHTMPDFLPDRLEAGTQNIPGIAGLLEGLKYIEKKGISNILSHERRLTLHAAEKLKNLNKIQVFCSPALKNQSGVLSFLVCGKDSEFIAERLAKAEVAVRAGLHCAPLAHQSAGTIESGTIRISLSAFTTLYDIERFVNILSSETA